MNKKGQYGSGPMGMPGVGGSYAHPLLFLGIFLFVAPFLGPIIHLNIPKWLGAVGIAFILIGAGLSMFRAGEV